MKYLLALFLSFFISLFFVGSVVTAPSYVYQKSIFPLTDNAYTLGTTTLNWMNIYTKQLCLNGDCKNSWQTGGSGSGTTTLNNTFVGFGNSDNTVTGTPTFTFNTTTGQLSVPSVSSSAVTSSVLASIPSQPFLVSTLTSSTLMAQSYSVFISGNYAYSVSLIDDSLTIIDVTNQSYPKIVGSLIDNTNLDGARNVYVAGKYAYIANQNDNSMAIVDISNPSSPVLKGKAKDNSLLNRAYFVNVSGKYAYVIANTDNSLRVIDISSSTNPQIVGGVKDNTNLAGAYGLNVSGRYAYVAASTDNSLRVVDLADPTNPTIVGGVKDANYLTAARAVYVSGRYAYVTAFNTSTLAIIDVSNPATTTPIVGYVRDTTNLNGVRSVMVQDGYAYVGAATNNSIAIVNIASSTNPSIVQVLKDDTNLNVPHGIYVAGNYLYAAMNTTTNPNFTIVGLNGLNVATANIGALKINSLNVQDDAVFNRNVSIYSGLNVGDRGINTSGDFTGNNLFLNGSATSTNFFSSGLQFTDANGTNITSTNAFFTSLAFGTANGTSLTSTNISFTNLSGTTITFTNASGTSITSTNIYSNGRTDFTSTTIRATTSDGTSNGLSILDSAGTIVSRVNSDGDIIGNLTGSSVILGGLAVDRQYAGLWLGQTSPNATNYMLLGYSQQTFINAPNSGIADIEFRVGNGTEASIGGNGLAIGIAGNTAPSYPFQVHTASSDFTVLSSGMVGVNTTTPTAALSFSASTTNTGGLLFGLDTNLYRSATDTLKTDDNFLFASGTSTNFFSGGLAFITASGTSITTTNAFVSTLGSTSLTFTNATGTGQFLIATSTITGGLFQTGFTDCSVESQTVLYNATTGKFACGVDGGGSSSLTNTLIAFGAADNALTSSTNFSFTTSTNILQIIGTVSSTKGLFVDATTTNYFSTGLAFSNLSGTNATTTNLAVTSLTNLQGGLTFITASGSSITSTNISFTRLNGTNATSTNLAVSGIANVGGITFINATGTGALSISTVSSTIITASRIEATDFLNAVSVLEVGVDGTDYSTFRSSTWSMLTNDDVAFKIYDDSNNINITSNVAHTRGLNIESNLDLNIHAPNGVYINTSTSGFFFGNATSTGYVRIATSTVTGGFFQTGLADCSSEANAVAYNATTGKFGCNTDSGGSSAFTSTVTVTDGITTSSLRADGLFIATSTSNMSGKFAVDSTGNVSTSGTLKVFGTSTFSNVSVTGTFTQTASVKPFIVGGVVSSTALNGAISVYVSGKYAYVANQIDDSLRIVDISNPTNPSIVGGVVSSTALNGASSVYVSGKYAYVANQIDDSLRIIDISNPSNPSIVGGVSSTALNGASSVYVSGKYAYIAASIDNSLRIIDISNPSNPSIVGGVVSSTALAETASVYVSGKYAYLGRYNGSALTIVDISNPMGTSTIVGQTAALPGSVRDVEVVGRYAYVGTDAGISIVDVSNPSTPVAVGNIGDFVGYSVYVAGSYLYAVDSGDTFFVVNIASSTAPVVVASLTDGVNFNAARDIFVSGKYAYVVADGNDSLQIIDLGGIDAPAANIGALQVNSINLSENLTVANSAYVTNGLNVGTGGIFTGGSIAVSGTSTSYIAGGLLVYSVSSTNFFATSTVFINASTTNFFANTSTISGAFFQTDMTDCDADNQSVAYDLTTGKFSCGDDDTGGGGLTISVNQIAFGAADGSVTTTGSFTFTTSTGLLSVTNVSSTSVTSTNMHILGGFTQSALINPTIVGSAASSLLDGINSVYVVGHYAYVTNAIDDSLRIIDISDPTAPTLVGGIKDATNLDQPKASFISGKYAYVLATNDNSLRIIDISDPVSPIMVGGIKDATNLNFPNSVYVSGKYAYVVYSNGTNDGLRIIDVSNPAIPTIVGGIVDSTNLDGASYVYVSGEYAYVANSNDNSVRIIDISNPVAPVIVGGVKDNTNLAGANAVYVSGKYAYVANTTDDSLRIIDISSSTAPSIVGGVKDSSILNGATSVYVSGKYAYVANTTDDSLRIIDISSSTAPSIVGGVKDSSTLNGVNAVYVSGKYAYVASNLQDGLYIVDIGGIDAPVANIGALQVNNLNVMDNFNVANSASIANGLSVGVGGIFSNGGLTVTGRVLGGGASSTQALLDIVMTSSTDVGAFRGSALRIVTNNSYGIGGAVTSSAKLLTVVSNATSTYEPIFSVDKYGFVQAQRGFISYDTYMGQEFNAEVAATTADAATWGDNSSWYVDEGTCSFSVLDNATGEYGGYSRSSNASAGSQCYMGMGLGAGDLTTFTKVNSLPTMLAKIRPSTSTALFHTWVGFMIDATALVVGAGATTTAAQTPTSEGIYFTNASGTTWTGRIDPPGAGPNVNLTCPSATISNTDWALLKIVVESTSTVRFFVDPQMADGINFIDCGASSSTAVTSNLGVAAVMMASSTTQMNLDVDYIRVWSDDPAIGGVVASQQNQSTEVDTRVFDPVTSADIAEAYLRSGDGSYEAGDLVAFDEGNGNDSIAVRKTNRPYDDQVMGVITYSPHTVLGSETSSTVRVALTGRVPVKVSFENGPILPGDPLTAASIPGYAMKAIKASKIVGYAVEGASSTSTANRGDFGGQILVALSPSTYTGHFDTGSTSTTKTGEDLLNELLGQQSGLPSGLALDQETQLFADNLLAMREVITPKVIADEIFTKKLVSFPDQDLNIVLDGDSRLVVMGKPAGTTSTIFSLDNQGNAFFAGLLTADKIRANQIIGLETSSTTFPTGLTFADVLSSLGSSTPVVAGLTSNGDVSITGGLLVTATSTFNSLIAGVLLASDIQSPVLDSLRALIENVSTSTSFALSQFTSSSEQTELRLSALENVVASSSVLINSLGEQFGNGLSFGSPITATAGLLVDSLSSLHEDGEISIMNNVMFFGRPYFTADTGGFAVIKQGAREVHVTFDQEYLGTPVVQAGMVYDVTSTESSEFTSSTTSVTSTVEDVVFGGDIRYVVLHVSSTGFIIRLNKPAPASISFSWIALAIRYPKLFESDPVAPISLPPEDTTPSSTPSPEPQSPPGDTPPDQNSTSSFVGDTTSSSTP